MDTALAHSDREATEDEDDGAEMSESGSECSCGGLAGSCRRDCQDPHPLQGESVAVTRTAADNYIYMCMLMRCVARAA
jgi:hypothetical protein